VFVLLCQTFFCRNSAVGGCTMLVDSVIAPRCALPSTGRASASAGLVTSDCGRPLPLSFHAFVVPSTLSSPMLLTVLCGAHGSASVSGGWASSGSCKRAPDGERACDDGGTDGVARTAAFAAAFRPGWCGTCSTSGRWGQETARACSAAESGRPKRIEPQTGGVPHDHDLVEA
jgi:hypothetical protein